MSKGIYKEKISSYELDRMDKSELKEIIGELEDELNRMFVIKEVSICALSEYVRSLEDKIKAIKIHQMYEKWRNK